jgi:hypothetical protein
MSEVEAVISQIIDDLNIEAVPMPEIGASRAYRRAKLSTAMRDVRNIVRVKRRIAKGALADSVEIRNSNLQAGTRAIAMLRAYGQGEYDECMVRERAFGKLRNAIGFKMVQAIGKVAQVAVSRRQRAKAISMLLALMEKEICEDIPEDETTERTRDGEILPEVKEGNALEGKMRLIDLRPKSEFCSKDKRVSRRHAPSGVILNPTRFVAAITTGNGNGLFAQRVRQKPGGCVLIDASGSMHATARNLKSICELVPTATLGYYSGTAQGKGDLCIYALNGKRFSSELPRKFLHSGNSVDLPAIQWMMKHPKPWVMVTDLGFCGGVFGSEIVAKALVERAVARGELTLYRSLDEAYAAFGGKGELKN